MRLNEEETNSLTAASPLLWTSSTMGLTWKGKKKEQFWEWPIWKQRERGKTTHNTENGREIDAGSALEALKLRGSEVGQAIRVDGAPYCCGASGNEAWPSVANPNQRTVPVRSCKRRFHCRRSNVVELLSLWLELEWERDHTAILACLFAPV